MRKLIVGVGMGFKEKEFAQIEKLANVGWDGVFTGFNEDAGNYEIAKKIKDCGLYYQSVHAKFGECYRMWEEGEEGELEMNRQICCVQNSSEIGVGIVVMHTIIGFDKHTPTQIGIDRFGKIVDTARKTGVKIAFENTEGLEYLDALMDAFKDDSSVGFCIDTGHEMCYNYSKDLISKFGDKLIATHLNDNMKISGKEITGLDDLHLLPFDGKGDWQGIANRLNKVGYHGDLTFELISTNKPGGHTHDIYSNMSFDEYTSLALQKAKQFRSMLEVK